VIIIRTVSRPAGELGRCCVGHRADLPDWRCGL